MKTLRNLKGLFTIAAALFMTAATAQDTDTFPTPVENYDQAFRLGFGLSAVMMTDDVYDHDLGVHIRLQYGLSTRTYTALAAGFTNLFIGGDVTDLGIISATGGLTAFWWEGRFSAHIDAG